MEKKTLKFDGKLAEEILLGEKDMTWRLFDDKNLAAGDDVILIKRPEMIEFAEAKLIEVYEKPMSEISEEDYDGHERYNSPEEMYQTFSGYYNRPVDANTKVKIIRFEVEDLL